MNAATAIGVLVIAMSANTFAQPTGATRASNAQKKMAAQPSRLGTAETVAGGELVLLEESCAFNGLGAGYALYVTNPRGTAIGKGCALPDALPPELGLMMVQWGASPVRGAESYQIDDFTWTTRGRVVLAKVLKERQRSKDVIATRDASEGAAKREEQDIVASLKSPSTEKPILGIIRSAGYPRTVLVIPRACRLLVESEEQTDANRRQMEWTDDGRVALGLSNSGDRVVMRGCVLPNRDGGITIRWEYDRPERLTDQKIQWEQRGREWMAAVKKRD